jgi:hypothetical protein
MTDLFCRYNKTYEADLNALIEQIGVPIPTNQWRELTAKCAREAYEMFSGSTDTWGRSYRVRVRHLMKLGISVTIISAGPDGQCGTDDDISSEMWYD